MTTMKIKKSCVENKQFVTASGSSLSEENYGFSRMSPAASYPVTSSPSHRRTSGPIRRAKGGWTPEEDETLRRAVELHKGRSWKKIAESIPDRTEVQCLHRWQKVINPELVKGSWTPLEDGVIINLVAKYGPTKWSVIAKSLPGRIGKQCRERWHNHLNPEIRKDSWTLEEEIELMKAHIKHGNKWAEIAKVIHGRTDNSIKNHWNSSLRKKLDCYLRTGKLPPVQGTCMFNTAQDAGSLGARQLIYCLNGGLETDVKNVPETARNVSSSLRAKVADKHDSVNPLTASVSDSHHLRPGKLSPVQRTGILNTAQDAENYGAMQLIHCSNGGLETEVKNVPDTACTVSSSLPVESSKVADQHDSVNPLSASVSEFHYLKASRFPPVQTTCVLNTAQYTGKLGNEKLIFCTNTGFETNVKNFPETAFTISSGLSIDSSKVADQHDSVNPWIASGSDSRSWRDVVVGEADSSVSGECDAQVPEIVPVYEQDASDSGVKYCKSIGKISQNEEPSETTLCSVPSNVSFLCYKPPRLEDLVISGHLSSIAHLTPFINCKCSSEQSIESFLKDAARSFPNTPSIIKRKEAYTSLPSDTDTDAMQSNEIRVHDGCTPNDGNVCSYTEGSRLSVSKFYSGACASNRALFTNEDDFNVSPPYRIWCKRKATFRSVEKQLDFTLAEGYSDGNAKDSSLAGNRSSLSPNSTTVQALSMQRRTLVENPSGGNERDFSSITKMGVV